MNEQLMQTVFSYLPIVVAVVVALLLALWLSLVIWAYRDMRTRSRDPFAYLLAALVVALLPLVGILVYLILRPPQTLAQAYQQMLEEEALLQEIENRPTCPGCSRVVDKNWLVCAHCHTRLKKACPDCNSLMDLQWTLCPFCGNQHIDPYRVEGLMEREPLLSPEPNGEVGVADDEEGVGEKTAVSPLND